MRAAKLTPLALKVLAYLEKHRRITAQEAFLYLDGTCSGSLTRRITELRDAGYIVAATQKHNPVTGKRYADYHYRGREKGLGFDPPVARVYPEGSSRDVLEEALA